MVKMRVLALHGYGQNAHIFKTQIGAVRRACSEDIEFVFLDGPVILHPPDQPGDLFSQLDDDGFPLPPRNTSEPDLYSTPRGWCSYSEDKKTYFGLDECFRYLISVLQKEKFDGVIGFSQGAALASYLCAYLEDPSAHPLFASRFHPPFKFAIFASGFVPVDPPLPALIKTPNLHVLGRHDTHIGIPESFPLVKACETPRVEYHDGGHFITTKATWRRFFREWMLCFTPESSTKPEEVTSPIPRLVLDRDSALVASVTPIRTPIPPAPAWISTPKWTVWTADESIVI